MWLILLVSLGLWDGLMRVSVLFGFALIQSGCTVILLRPSKTSCFEYGKLMLHTLASSHPHSTLPLLRVEIVSLVSQLHPDSPSLASIKTCRSPKYSRDMEDFSIQAKPHCPLPRLSGHIIPPCTLILPAGSRMTPLTPAKPSTAPPNPP